MKKHAFIIAIVVLSLVTHFMFFGHPREVVFDEVHFGGYVSGYVNGEYFFDIHPPLGKLLIYGSGLLFGFNADADFAHIGNQFTNTQFLALRLLPTLAGFLLPLIIFFLSRKLGLSKFGSFVAAMLIIFENALLVQSKFILLDSFLLLFGFSALLSYFYYRDSEKRWQIILAFILAALALSVKWTGATFLGIIGLMELYRAYKGRSFMMIWKLVGLTAVSFAVYFLIFAIHFGLLPSSGKGDGFMTPEFRKSLVNSTDYDRDNLEPSGLFNKFIETNNIMYITNAGLDATHPYSTKPEGGPVYDWFTWPMMIRPIYYWSGQSETIDIENGTQNIQGRVYLIGNPIVWWLASFAVLFLILSFFYDLPETIKRRRKVDHLGTFLVFAFLVNFIPFAFIDRALFLYHYFPALVFSIIALAYVIDMIPKKERVAGVVLLIVFLFFMYFAPLTYGTKLNQEQYNHRNWLESWI